MFSSPPPLRVSHRTFFSIFCFRFFFFFSFSFSLLFFFFPRQTSESKLQCSNCPPTSKSRTIFSIFFFSFFFFFLSFNFFPRQTSKSDLKVPTSNFEVGTSNPNFNARCSPPSPPRASHPLSFLFFFSFFFFLFFFLLFFFPRQTSKPDFKVPTSNFEVGTLKPDFKVQTCNLKHLWQLHGRALLPNMMTIWSRFSYFIIWLISYTTLSINKRSWWDVINDTSRVFRSLIRRIIQFFRIFFFPYLTLKILKYILFDISFVNA